MQNDNDSTELKIEEKNKDRLLPISILAAAVIIGGARIYTTGLKYQGGSPAQVRSSSAGQSTVGALEAKVLPPEGIVLPVHWGNLGAQMISAGVIDAEKFEQLYAGRGGLDEEARQLLYGENGGSVKITPHNSGMLLNLLWAFGLANRNPILEKGPMMDPHYGGANRFASTAGWILAVGDPMNHYSRHRFVEFTEDEQELVERVSQGIYRPCCGNSTYFPDCNHGMAMLGLLGLLAANGVSESEMYRIALQVNAYWFPDTYLTIAALFERRGLNWENVDSREVLGANYSSAQGFNRVLAEIEPIPAQGGGGCGV